MVVFLYGKYKKKGDKIMRNGQIFKIKSESTGQSKYAICYDANKNLLYSEEGKYYIYEADFQGDQKLIGGTETCPLRTDLMGLMGLRNRVRGMELAETRNVPETVREGLNDMLPLLKAQLKDIIVFNKLKSDIAEKQDIIKQKQIKLGEQIRRANGTLTKEEFLRAFRDGLSPEVKRAIDDSTQRGYFGEREGEWEFNFYVHIQMSRNVYIEKYARPSFSYLEYDDTRQISSDAEKDPSYQAYMKKYRKELPVSQKIRDYLSLGDKNTLTYHGSYMVEIDPSKPFTKEYAEKLADKFCGIRREKNREDKEVAER